MSAQDADISDPLWFLETPEDSESKDYRNEISENTKSQGISELERWRQEHAVSNTNRENQTNTKRTIPELIDWDNIDSNSGNDADKNANQIDIESTDEFKQSVTTDKNSAIRIVLKSDELDNPIVDHEISKTTEQQSKPEIRIKFSDEMKQSFNNENETKFNAEKSIDNSKRPTIYVLLKDKDGSIGNVGNTDSNTETCTEIGSTVINVNDFLAPEDKLSGNESISTAVSYSPSGKAADSSPQQMELVITIKDERDKSKETTFKLPSEEREIPIKREQSVDFNFNNVGSRARSSSNYMTSNEASWESFNDSRWRGRGGDGGETEYREERDSWVRETDGARCHRTVVTTPRGRKVHTHCYKDAGEQAGPRRTTVQRREDWSSAVTSFFDDLDDELSGFFNQVNRFIFY